MSRQEKMKKSKKEDENLSYYETFTGEYEQEFTISDGDKIVTDTFMRFLYGGDNINEIAFGIVEEEIKEGKIIRYYHTVEYETKLVNQYPDYKQVEYIPNWNLKSKKYLIYNKDGNFLLKGSGLVFYEFYQNDKKYIEHIGNVF